MVLMFVPCPSVPHVQNRRHAKGSRLPEVGVEVLGEVHVRIDEAGQEGSACR